MPCVNVREAILSKVTVYQFTLYDITTDRRRKSRRWATYDAVERLGGDALLKTAAEVEASVLDPDTPGMTYIDFDPRRGAGPKGIVSV
jgi:hypothetical protein